MKRVFLLLGGSVLFGSFAASFSTDWQMILALVFVSLGAMAFLWKTRSWQWGVLAAGCLWLGFGAFGLKDAYYAPLAQYDEQTIQIAGTIESEVRKSNGHYQYQLETQLEGRPFVLLLTTPKEILDADIGDHVTADCLLYAPSSGYWFDSERTYHSQNIWLTGYLAQPDLATVTKGVNGSPLLWIKRLSQEFRQKLQNNPRLSREVSGVLQSMVLGDRTNLDAAIQQSYSNAGAAHLFAVSGMHLMALIGLLLWMIPRRFVRIRFGVAVMVTVVFTVVTGGHLSTVRSGWMLTMQLLAPCFHRSNDGVNSLFFTGFAMTLLDPLVVLDLGFLLSFSAMLGLTALYPLVRRWLNRRVLSKTMRGVLSAICATFCVQIAVFPVTLWQFECVSALSPVSNLLLVPLLAPIIVLGVAYVLLLPVVDLTLLRLVLSLLVEAENRLAEWLGSFHAAQIGLGHPAFRIWFVLAVLGIGLMFYVRRSSFAYRVTGYLVGLFVVFTMFSQYALSREQVLYLVGDGECADLVLNDRGEVTIIAVGDNDWVDAMTLRLLQKKGIHTVDAYIQLEPVQQAVEDTRRLAAGVTLEEYYYPEEGMAVQNLPVEAIHPLQQGTTLSFLGGSDLYFPAGEDAPDAVLSSAGVEFWMGKASTLTDAPESAVLLMTSLSGQTALYEQHFCVLIGKAQRLYPGIAYLDASMGVMACEFHPQSFLMHPVE